MNIFKSILLVALSASGFNLFAAADCQYAVDNEWNSGFVGNITIINTGNAVIDGWQVNWQYTDGSVFGSGWNAQFTTGANITASNLAWNGQINPGQSVTFGFQGTKGTADTPAPLVMVDGAVCGGDTSNLPPEAAFSFSANDLSVVLDASASSDPESEVLSYNWDFGDGSSGSGVSPTHLYAVSGTYTIALSVSDGTNTTLLEKDVTVLTPGPNRAPTAAFSATVSGLVAVLDGTSSSDPDGDNLTFQWEFGDNGSDTGVSVSHTYGTEGDFIVTLTVSDGELTDVISQTLSVSDVIPPGQHVANPFLGATAYLNPDYSALIDSSIALESDAAVIAKMQAVKSRPTAVWLDRIDAIFGGAVNSGRLSLEGHLLEALQQKQSGVPITVSIVVYNLPDRDCAALASNGTLNADNDGLAIYKRDYIDAIADIVSDPRFADLRIVATIEPDSLPNLVTNTNVAACGKVASDGTYVDGISYALATFSQIPTVYTYLDIAHSGWLGWDNNLTGSVQLYTDLVSNVAAGDMTVVDGFVTNVSNYTPVEEIFLPDPDFDFDGDFVGIRSSSYFQWNPVFDEKDFAEALHARFVANGFPQDIAILVDTSRNGWGGASRPRAANDTASTEDQYVLDSRLDKRNARGNWCNVSGAGIGSEPQVLPFGNASVIEAYVWIKPPGESDGTSDSSQTTPDDEGKSFDPNCSPTFTTSDGVLTGAMDGAPPAGSWFPAQFRMLINNANPVL